MKSEELDLGSVRDVLQTSSAEMHDSFGNAVEGEYSAADCDAMFGFSGRDWDSDSELYLYRPRRHDPTPGKWLNLDSVGFEASEPNLYRYVANEKEG